MKATAIGRILTQAVMIMTYSSLVLAGEVIVKIKSVDESKARIVVKLNNDIRVNNGDLLSVSDDCSLEVLKKTQSLLVLNTELCDQKSMLKKGKNITLQSKDIVQESVQDRENNSFYASNSQIMSNGIRLAFVKSFLSGKLKLNSGIYSGSVSDDVEHDFGLSFGYANVKTNDIGFLTSVMFTQYNKEVNAIRLDGNGTYGITENVYLLGGINLHKFTKGSEELNIGLGFQFGAGFQFNKKFGIGLSYVTINNSGDSNGVDLDLNLKGLEVSISGTF